MPTLDDYVVRAEHILKLVDETLATATKPDPWGQFVDAEKFARMKSAGLSFILTVYGSNHPHYHLFINGVESATPSETGVAKGILITIHEELAGGWLRNVRSLAAGEIFADLLEMAEHFLSPKSKDAAAVLCSSVLEEHLRKLAGKHGIELSYEKDGRIHPKKADTLNGELAKKQAYNAVDAKAITYWLGIRNHAVHGEFEKYTLEQVENIHAGIRSFTSRIQV